MKAAIIVDIDGTIADIRTRMEIADDLYSRDDPRYYPYCNSFIMREDTPVPGAFKGLLSLMEKHKATPLFISGRRNTFLAETLEWMNGAAFLHKDHGAEVYLRPVGMEHVEWKRQIMRILATIYDFKLSIGDSDSDEQLAIEFDIPFKMVHPDGWNE